MTQKQEQNYSAEQIEKLSPKEHVRKRPGMYIGNTENPFNLLVELIDNALDEVQNLRGKHEIVVYLDYDENIYGVRDTGRGIPWQIHKQEKLPTIVLVAQELFAGGKFKKDNGAAYKISAGLHGVGLTVINYLSEWLKITSAREGYKVTANFIDGEWDKNLVKEKFDTRKNRGTQVLFKPDKRFFDSVVIPYEQVRQYLQLVSLDKEVKDKVTFKLVVKQNGQVKTEIISSDLKNLPLFAKTGYIIDSLYKSDTTGESIYIAFGYSDDKSFEAFGLVNLKPVHQGTHITFAKTQLLDILWSIAQELKLSDLTRNDLQLGLKLFVSTKIVDVKFSSQTKEKLTTQLAYFNKAFLPGFKQNLETIIKRGRNYSYIKEVLKKLNELKKSLKKIRLSNISEIDQYSAKAGKVERGNIDLPNLKDCLSPDPEKSELFIVEGESAGGTLLKARDPRYHGVLTLTGITINAIAQADKPERLYKNKDVLAILKALGLKPHASMDDVTKKMRYGKIIAFADPDAFGSQINLLIMGILAELLPNVLKAGRFYIVEAPLHIAYNKRTGERKFIRTKEEFVKYVADNQWEVVRNKGLGELDADELYEAAIDPKTRFLYQIVVKSDDELNQFKALMKDGQVKKAVLVQLGLLKLVQREV